MNTEIDTGGSFKLPLEIFRVGVTEDQLNDGGGIGIALVDIVGQITLEAARVVLKRSKGVAWVGGVAWNNETSRAKVDLKVLEGTAGNAATTAAGWESDGREARNLDNDIALVVDLGTIAGERSIAAIEDGVVREASDSALGPVPVWQIALVGALLTESLLKGVDVVAVPVHESSLSKSMLISETPTRQSGLAYSVMDGERLRDMNTNKVVISALDTGSHRRRSARGLGLQALDRTDVILLLRNGEVDPAQTHKVSTC